MIRLKIAVLCCSLFLLYIGCDHANVQAATEQTINKKTAAASPADSTQNDPTEFVLLKDSVELQLYEVPSEALLGWYDLRSLRPALLLYSSNPFLQMANKRIQKSLVTVLANRDKETLRFGNVDPAILPRMTVDAALNLGLFSAVYWVLPSIEKIADLSVETFRNQMMQSGALTQKEALTLTLRNGIFSGTVRGVPFHALHPEANFTISGPAVLHFDLSYLASLYKGEFKTPTYPLVYQALKNLRNRQLEAIAASFSYSQVTREISLGSRFVGDVIKQLFKQPQILDEKLPEAWQQHANALYLPNMYLIEDARKILLTLAQAQPDNPSLHYALYNVSRAAKATSPVALRHLADAVQHDPVYALEYIALAPIAREKGHLDEALRMLSLAHDADPNNPFITLELARALIIDDRKESAVPLLHKLQSLNWSEIYYADLPAFLEQQLTEAVKQGPADSSQNPQ